MEGRTRQRSLLRGAIAALALLLVAVAAYALAGGGDDEEGSRAQAPETSAPAPAPGGAPGERAAGPGASPPVAAVREYHARLAAGDAEGSATRIAPGVTVPPDTATGRSRDGLVAADGPRADVRSTDPDLATVTFRPWLVVRAGTGCAQYPSAAFELVRAEGSWRIAAFPALPERVEACDCADAPWPRTPTPVSPAGRDAAASAPPALRRLRAQADFYAEAAPAGWPESVPRPPLAIDDSGAVTWDRLRTRARAIGFVLRARDVNVHVLLRRPAELGCVSVGLAGRRATERPSVTVTPDRTTQHETIFLPYRDGLHWSKAPLERSDGVTLHVNGLPAGTATALPRLRFQLYAPAAPTG